MYLYLLYLLGYYTYEDDRITNSNDTLENIKFLESRNKIFPRDTTIIKNRDMISNNNEMYSNYHRVIDELKERITKRDNIKIKYKKVLDELQEKFNSL